jgi:CheY-like chemotaxis protein
MNQKGKPLTILYADDDPEDQMLMKEALEKSYPINQLHFVENGVDLMDYLRRQGKYADMKHKGYPDLILLNLNMPKKDGRETLEEIKADPDFRRIPIVVLTGSKSSQDIHTAYDLGASGFIIKPLTFESLTDTLTTVVKYWSEIVKLPVKQTGH